MKKTIVSLMAAFILVLSSFSAAYASSIPMEEIPERYTPNTTIEYQKDGSWKVIEKQVTIEENESDEQELVSSRDRTNEDLIVKRIEEESEQYPHYQEVRTLPAPVVGMRVYYDPWGEIKTIKIQNHGQYVEVEPQYTIVNIGNPNEEIRAITALPQGTRKPAGTYTYGTVEPNSVGYTTNTIKITTGSVLGTGDFTCFTDTIGDHNNYLQYGDCATKGSYDNPWYGTVIYARNMTNNVGTSFIKNDNGGLPYAVLDIWKTGLTKLGVTSTNYGNIKFAGRYYYPF